MGAAAGEGGEGAPPAAKRARVGGAGGRGQAAPAVGEAAAAPPEAAARPSRTAAERAARGEAPVRAEFLRPVGPPAAVRAPETGNGQERGGAEQNGAKSKAMLKKERAAFLKDGSHLCNGFSRGQCKFGNSCKYSHDLEKFWKLKPPDLPGKCPFEHANGMCRFSVGCRYARSHSAKSNCGLTVQQTQPSPPLVGDESTPGPEEGALTAVDRELPLPSRVDEELNPLSKDIQVALRKNDIKFTRSTARLKELGLESKLRGKPKREMSDFPAKVCPVDRVQRTSKDFEGKLYLAPLTTVGNLPFRRVCKGLGVDITCGEMALATNLLRGHQSEWALLKRHPSEDFYGVQIAGGYPDSMARCAEVVNSVCDVDFVDINMGCPIDMVCNAGAGAFLPTKPRRMESVVRAMAPVLDCPLTFKVRTGYKIGQNTAHTFMGNVADWGAAAVTLHGRTREQRYTKTADWEYIQKCAAEISPGVPLIGNGDIFSYQDFKDHTVGTGLSSCMIGRGALIKPWLFTEIKEQRIWDISAGERLDIVKQYCAYGLEHWGSDSRGVENTRRFVLEWLSYLHRYIPVGLLEVLPAKMNHRPPAYFGRSELETLLASENPTDWIRISEWFLGPPPKNFTFTPKHTSNAYSAPTAAA